MVKAPWLRVQATLSSDPRIIRSGFLGGVVYRAVLEMMKAQGWNGRVERDQVDGIVLARHLNCGPGDPSPADLEGALVRVIRVGLLEIHDESLVVPLWDTFQPDARPYSGDREPKGAPGTPKPSRGVPGSPGKRGDVTGLDATRPDATGPDASGGDGPNSPTPATVLEPEETGTPPVLIDPAFDAYLRARGKRWDRHPGARQLKVMAEALRVQGISQEALGDWLTNPKNAARSDFEMRDDLAPKKGGRRATAEAVYSPSLEAHLRKLEGRTA